MKAQCEDNRKQNEMKGLLQTSGNKLRPKTTLL